MEQRKTNTPNNISIIMFIQSIYVKLGEMIRQVHRNMQRICDGYGPPIYAL